jgi:hypothetical protein
MSLRRGAVALVLLAALAACSSGDDEPEVAGVEIDRDAEATTTSSSTTTTSTTTTSTSTTVAPAGTTTTAAPRTTTTTTAVRRPPPPPATTTTTTTAPPPTLPPQEPGTVEGVLTIPAGTRGRLFLIDANTDAVRASDELPSSGEFSFGDVSPGDYRVDTSVVSSDGAATQDRGEPFQVGQASTVRLTCDPRCVPA